MYGRERDSRMSVCVYGIYTYFHVRNSLSADNYFVQCNKHPKNSKQLIISPVCFHGSKPEYNDEP